MRRSRNIGTSPSSFQRRERFLYVFYLCVHRFGRRSPLGRALCDAGVEVDGGISSHNAHEVFGAGADVLVAGNAVFGAEDPQAEIVKMLNA